MPELLKELKQISIRPGAEKEKLGENGLNSAEVGHGREKGIFLEIFTVAGFASRSSKYLKRGGNELLSMENSMSWLANYSLHPPPTRPFIPETCVLYTTFHSLLFTPLYT